MTATHLQQFRRFAQYNAWFNGRIFEQLSAMEDSERRRDCGAFFASIHGTLSHILLGDRLWLGRFARPAPGNDFRFASLDGADLVYEIQSMKDDLFPAWDDLCAQREATDRVLRDFVFELTPALLEVEFHYKNSKGVAFASPLWLAVAHVFNHQTHHRGQVTTLLHQQGIDPGMTDFMVTSVMPEETP